MLAAVCSLHLLVVPVSVSNISLCYLFYVTTDAVTELHVSNSKLAEVEAAFTTQKSEVRFFVDFLGSERKNYKKHRSVSVLGHSTSCTPPCS